MLASTEAEGHRSQPARGGDLCAPMGVTGFRFSPGDPLHAAAQLLFLRCSLGVGRSGSPRLLIRGSWLGVPLMGAAASSTTGPALLLGTRNARGGRLHKDDTPRAPRAQASVAFRGFTAPSCASLDLRPAGWGRRWITGSAPRASSTRRSGDRSPSRLHLSGLSCGLLFLRPFPAIGALRLRALTRFTPVLPS